MWARQEVDEEGDDYLLEGEEGGEATNKVVAGSEGHLNRAAKVDEEGGDGGNNGEENGETNLDGVLVQGRRQARVGNEGDGVRLGTRAHAICFCPNQAD